MNNPGSSPSFKNLKYRKIESPKHLKEKMRKDYKNNVQTCRDMILNRYRGSSSGSDLKKTLTEIYNSTFNNFTKNGLQIEATDLDEVEIFEEMKEELIQNELDWWLEEYEKSCNDNIDWSTVLKDDSVICLLCQKNNFILANQFLSCTHCNIEIKTEMPLARVRKQIEECLQRHGNICNGTIQFMSISEQNGTHIYCICETCMDMQFIV